MNEHIVLTGATGAIGLPLAAELLSRANLDRLTLVARPGVQSGDLTAELLRLNPSAAAGKLKVIFGDLTDDRLHFQPPVAGAPVTAVIHGAAFTKFRDAGDQWNRVNVAGTHKLLEWRKAICPDAHFIHLSTLCAAGKSVGVIAESPLNGQIEFVNGYERSKWEAEQLVQNSSGPVTILRLATIVGNLSDGKLHRVGAFHHVLHWVYRGLLPMIPGDARTTLDLIPTEYVTDGITRLLSQPSPSAPTYHHFSRGSQSIPLVDLIRVCTARFSRESDAWKRSQIDAPVLASPAAFEEFRRSVIASRDLLFTQVLESVDSFLPELFYPKQFVVDSTLSLFGGTLPLGNWEEWIGRVLDFSLRSNFGRNA